MKKLIFVTCALALASIANAQLIANFTGGDDLSVGPGTAGYDFTVGSVPLTVQSLGIWAADSSGLFSSHEVGIWDMTPQHNLLAEVNITPSAVALNSFLYASITPLTLSANTSYVIAAQYADSDFDYAKGNVPSVTMSGARMGDALLSTGSGFGFPDLDVSGANLGFIGPNAAFLAVPEPAATSLIAGLCLLLVAVYRRWQIT